MIFTTSYKTLGKRHIATIYAKSKKQCKRFIRQRNLGEKIIGWVKHDNGTPIPTDFNEKLHEGAFLGFVGVKSSILTVDEVLGDFGLLHRMAHTLQFGTYERDEQLLDKELQRWRELIPGYLNKKR